MGFSRQEYWSGLPVPPPGDLPDPGIEPGSPTLQAASLPSEPPGSPYIERISSPLCYTAGPCCLATLWTIACICQCRRCGRLEFDPWLGRCPGNGSPLQYSCLENPMDGGAWWATVHGVTKSRTGLSNFTFFSLLNILKY